MKRRTGLRGYYAHIAALDECFHRLLVSLDRARIAEDTIVVFTSDHGDMMLSQGLTTKLHPWDESIRVPFLVQVSAQTGNQGPQPADASEFAGHFSNAARPMPASRSRTLSMAPIIPAS